jgi:hypothetical protein
VTRWDRSQCFLRSRCATPTRNARWSAVLATIPEPACAGLNILARRNGHGSRLADHAAMPSGLASKRNKCVRTSNRDRDSKVDRQQRPRLSPLRNMVRDRSRVRILDRHYNTLHSLLPRRGPKAEEPLKSFAVIWVPFRSHFVFCDQRCTSSYNNIRFRQNFTRLHLQTAKFAATFYISCRSLSQENLICTANEPKVYTTP